MLFKGDKSNCQKEGYTLEFLVARVDLEQGWLTSEKLRSALFNLILQRAKSSSWGHVINHYPHPFLLHRNIF